ncbi:MAG: hypothetical protein F4X82_00680 [Candidatus Spechtbacteria bacterium SB0662_bin_43]|uniref:Uncharacterized protein n=1 Tax=Candidatus Spechtbacteria bacterium SB0662_bin_43 TaxID=2604897 RepID=A0A845D8H4_9BACT|nr:hypothetical protein [Candidatus Spechtbacteria bacterium SB0662_bin_43]
MVRIQWSLLTIVFGGLIVIVVSDVLGSGDLDPTAGMLIGGALAGIGITTLFMVEQMRGVVGATLILVGTVIGYNGYAAAQNTPTTESITAVLVVGLISLLVGVAIAFISTYLLTED